MPSINVIDRKGEQHVIRWHEDLDRFQAAVTVTELHATGKIELGAGK